MTARIGWSGSLHRGLATVVTDHGVQGRILGYRLHWYPRMRPCRSCTAR
ncbi:hypothetical protein [Marinactinospora rubrisoli]|uniref:Uncharacterized protein n=1 Tax=Marinactinospora rubrisoli TaxID=2715399 RepID=A0ABW2KF34_9ACTN